MAINYEYIDPEIRRLIKSLNDHKYYTKLSCAGHKNDPGWYKINGREQHGRGFVWFTKPYKGENLIRIIKILKLHGCTGIEIEFIDKNHTACRRIAFNALGKPYIKRYGELIEPSGAKHCGPMSSVPTKRRRRA